MRGRMTWLLVGWVVGGVALSTVASAQARQASEGVADDSAKIAELLQTTRQVGIIVWLKDNQFTAPTYQADLNKKRAEIRNIQDAVLSSLSPQDFTLTYRYTVTNGFAGTVTKPGFEKLHAHPQVAQMFLDRRMRATLIESRPLVTADQVENTLGFTGAGVTVCVLDTGVDYTHPNLPFIAGDDFIEFDGDPMDDHGHGTHVAGTVASTDGTIRGIAPGAGLAAVKVLDAGGGGDASSIGAGIDWCANNASLYNIKVITMSLGEYGAHYSVIDCPAYLDPAIANAFNAGIFVDAASGNDGFFDGISYPACAPGVTSVGATYDADVGPQSCDGSTQPDQLTCFTSRGPNLDLLAPGSVITSTTSGSGSVCGAPNGGGFGDCSGTSMAAPHVAGAAALLLEAKPYLQPGDIENLLRGTGVAVSDPITLLTFPRIDTVAAVSLSNNPPVLNPVGNKAIAKGQLLVIQLVGSDPDSDPIQYAIGAAGLQPPPYFDPVNGVFAWTPSAGGMYAVTFSVSDVNASGVTLSDSETVIITVVTPPNNPPVLQPIGNKIVDEGQTLTIQLQASDPDNNPLTFGTDAASVLPSAFSFNASTGLFSWTPTSTDQGSYTVTFSVTDGQASDSEPIFITVVDNPNAPSQLCGTTLTTSTVLTTDVLNCPIVGLYLGADNITLDCAGHTISSGPSGQTVGVVAFKKNLTIKNCIVQGFHSSGISLGSNTMNSLVTNNTANGNTIGFLSFGGSNNTFQSNTAYDNNIGFEMTNGSTNETFISNMAKNNNAGFTIYSAWSNTVMGNTIKNNDIGVSVGSSGHDNTITSNKITGNTNGLELANVSGDPIPNNLIYNNLFSNPTNAVDAQPDANIWNVAKTAGVNIVGGPFLGGNFWSDYTGKDLDGDGLGDTQLPYTSNGKITNGGDFLPLLIPCPDFTASGTFSGGTWTAKSTCPKPVL